MSVLVVVMPLQNYKYRNGNCSDYFSHCNFITVKL